MAFEVPGDIRHSWTQGVGFLGLKRRRIEVHAWQVELGKEFLPGCSTARVIIIVDGKTELETDIPWPMPNGNITLPLQVFLLAKMPLYEYAEWQPILEQFARSCEHFCEPLKIWWGQSLP